MTTPRDDIAGLSDFFDQGIEPEPTCANCEYFDGGGLSDNGKPLKIEGDCHNRQSPFFTTTQGNLCTKFFPCSTRWPDADHG